ncbi:hypothetical protein MKP08_09575 [Erythrobacter sp. LQ02-29]|uniref:hypothetical protein n=1 Tax=unclassified Erythrobacter TaxID=2633097 RepID=UPI001BFC95B8|nr:MULTISPECIES: hypothetical protein [unclassified Erythrobacter]MCP9222995.1 hypothetical protein [Erythrobacter sp. LQ02-29]QWC55814.1 hypothetical protein F7D01_00775 [Erythrobacter sp. 3-20A1M]
MSLYQRARRHALKMLGLVGVGVVFIIAFDQWVGHSSIAFAIVIFGLFVGNIGILGYNCPRCRSNLFFRRFIMVPWPNRTCTRCGLDLTRVD